MPSRASVEYWSLVAEIIAAIAVVVSLVFVGLQLQSANVIAAREESNATMQQWSNIRRSIYQDEGTARIYTIGLAQPDELSPVEIVRFRLLIKEHVWASWQIWDRIRNGLTPENHWEEGAGKDLLDLLCTPGGSVIWREIEGEVPRPFAEAVAAQASTLIRDDGSTCPLG